MYFIYSILWTEPNGHWGHGDFIDPLHRWDWKDVKAAHGANPNDVYGKLYCYLFDLICSVHKRVHQELRVDFQLIAATLEDLKLFFPSRLFDRIEVRRATSCSLGLLFHMLTVDTRNSWALQLRSVRWPKTAPLIT